MVSFRHSIAEITEYGLDPTRPLKPFKNQIVQNLSGNLKILAVRDCFVL